MSARLTILLMVLLCGTTSFCRADAPWKPPTEQDFFSPNKNYCAHSNPAANETTVFRIESDAKRTTLWTIPEWFRSAFMADDGKHLVVGFGDLNLIPKEYKPDMVMIRFIKEGKVIATVPLKNLFDDLGNLKKTVSHYSWGHCEGFDKEGLFTVVTEEEKRLFFDVTTGKLIKKEAVHKEDK